MRTNIVINDTLVEQAMLMTGKKTKKAVVEMALHHLINSQKKREALSLKGKVKWVGDLATMRLA